MFHNATEVLLAFLAILGLLMLVPYIFFLQLQQKTLLAVAEENRLLKPGQVWLQLIPLYGLFWQFTVIKAIADSLRNELESRNKASMLGMWDGGEIDEVNIHPTYATGKAYAILVCISLIPIIGFMTGLFMLILWITYWGQLNKYRKMLEDPAIG